MEDYQQRVRDECAELDARIDRLHAFIGSPGFSGLHPTERDRLLRQRAAMRKYSGILHERISAFTVPA